MFVETIEFVAFLIELVVDDSFLFDWIFMFFLLVLIDAHELLQYLLEVRLARLQVRCHHVGQFLPLSIGERHRTTTTRILPHTYS